MSNQFIGLTTGILDDKHRLAMGNAIWLYMWLVHRQFDIDGKVYNGRKITYENCQKVYPTMSWSTYTRYMDRLKKQGYIKTTNRGHGVLIEIVHPKKWTGIRKVLYQDTKSAISDIAKMPYQNRGLKTNIKTTNKNIYKKQALEIFNHYLKMYPMVNANYFQLTKPREAKIIARLKNTEYPTTANLIKKAISNASKSEFYSRKNITGWNCDLDWIIHTGPVKGDNVEKMLNLVPINQQDKKAVSEEEANEWSKRNG